MKATGRRIPTVLLWLDLSTDFSRQLARGIHDYALEHGPWNMVAELPSDLRLSGGGRQPAMRWGGIDGVLVRLLDDRVGRALARFGGPRVVLAGYYSQLDVPRILGDSEAAVRLVVDHLWDRGYRRLAYCGFHGVGVSSLRQRLFRQIAGARDCPVSVYRSTHRRPASQVAEQSDLVRWLQSLDKPVGIMAMNDVRGRHLTEACKLARIAVPEEVGVIGVDNEQLLCELSDPPLSSVDMNSYQIGYRGARMLDAMMRGRRPDTAPAWVEPAGVVARASTSVTMTDDPLVAQAAAFIEQHIREGINVEDVLSALGVSRSNLERRFRQATGRTPRQEIENVRLDLAKRLLRMSDLTVSQAAAAAGYRDGRRLHEALRRVTGRTPGEWRQAYSV